MPRQVLTFVFVFFAIMMAMRMCAPKETAPPPVTTEAVAEVAAADSIQLGPVRLANDGTIASIADGNKQVLQPVPAWRRPFHLLVHYADGSRRGLDPEAWDHVEVPGGAEFTYTRDAFVVRKRILRDGYTLRLLLKVEGAPADVRGFELTGVSGVPLAKAGSLDESGTFWLAGAGKPKFVSFGSLVQHRERQHRRHYADVSAGKTVSERPVLHRREVLAGDKSIRYSGILGADHYVALVDVVSAHAVNFDAYRARRGVREDNEIETWVSLLATDGGIEREFQLRWGRRDAIAELAPGLDQDGSLNKANTYTVENDIFRAVFTDRGAALLGMWLKRYSIEAGAPLDDETWIPILREGVRAGDRALTLRANAESYGSDLVSAVWKVETERDTITFTLDTNKGYHFEKRVHLPAEGYALTVDVRVRRPEGVSEKSVKYSVIGPAGTFIEDSYRGIIGAEPPAGILLERRGGNTDDQTIDSIADDSEPFAHTYAETHQRGLLRAVGVRGAYFLCALVTEERKDDKGRPAGTVTEAMVRAIELDRAIDRADGEPSRRSLRGELSCAVPYEDGEASSTYRLYAGPTALEHLRGLELQEAVDFGFFGFIGRSLMWLMKLLQGLVSSYGLAIIFMTLIVRGLLLPVSYRMQVGMQRYSKRLQKIKPILDELQKKYGKDRNRMNQERMKVMREHKVGFPLGCLMIFFQIPIWFALFGALRVEFSIRHESFLWATDLSMPDRLLELSFWPHWFNFLPILMLVLWVLQQKLAPSPGGDDPQVQMQMKMVKFMPYVFFFMLYKYAAALSVYMCVSSAWSIAESKLVRRAIKRME